MKNILRKYGTLIGLILIFLVFSMLKPNVFPTIRNLVNILEQVSLLSIIAMGATVIMVIGEFDLSLASITSFAGIITAGLLVAGLPMFIVIPLVLISGFAFGMVNGILVSKLNILSFITTLSTGTFLGGITFWYSGGTIIFSGIPDNFLIWGQGELLGLPIPTLLMVFIFIIFWYIFNQTMLGRHLYAIGGNQKAARYSGVKIDWNKIIAFALAGMLASLTGIILTSKLGSAHPTAGGGYLLKSYATVFLGMTLFKEGEPNIAGTLIGVLIIGVLANGLTILSVPNYFQDMLTGAIIISALVFQGMKVQNT